MRWFDLNDFESAALFRIPSSEALRIVGFVLGELVAFIRPLHRSTWKTGTVSKNEVW